MYMQKVAKIAYHQNKLLNQLWLQNQISLVFKILLQRLIGLGESMTQKIINVILILTNIYFSL